MRSSSPWFVYGVLAASLALPGFAFAQCQGQRGGGGPRNSSTRTGGPTGSTGRTTMNTALPRSPGLQTGLPNSPGLNTPFGNPQIGLNNPLAMPPQLQLMIQQQQQQALNQAIALQQVAAAQRLQQLAVQQTTPVLQQAVNNPNLMVRFAAYSELSRRQANSATYAAPTGQ